MFTRLPTPSLLIALALLTAAQLGCNREEPLTRAEAQEALDEAQLSSEASALTHGMVTLTTDFTLADAAEHAAANLRDFVRTQVPCAEVELVDRTVSIDFGVMGECAWNGKTWTGRTEVTVQKVDATLEVSHVWTDLSDGYLTVNGDATVTWSRDEATRRVVHTLEWTDGERTGTGTGDRVQSRLETGDGVRVDGARTWTGSAGNTWTLDIDGVEMRGIDPLPQSGSYTLTHPAGKTLSLSFARVDDLTILVTITNGKREFSFEVRRNP